MKRKRSGFTLIEVAIFLAITGILFVGVTVGVQNSIYQQRTNDAVQNFMEFLRTAYAEVNDVQTTTNGNTNMAVYGKLITFGDNSNLAGDSIASGSEIFKYTVVGDIDNSISDRGALDILRLLHADITYAKDDNQRSLAGIAEAYTPRWAAQIEPACKGGKVDSCDSSFDPIKGMMLIVRHPISGAVTTLWSDEMPALNMSIKNYMEGGNIDIGNLIFNDDNKFGVGQIDFCVNTTGEKNVYNRMDVRVTRGAGNASGVEAIGSSTEGYKCGS